MQRVTFVTGNKNKLAEMKAIMGNAVDIVNVDLDLEEIQASNVTDVAIDKAQKAASIVKGPVIVEDVGLGMEALGGMPGPFIKFFLDKVGPNGLVSLLAGHENKTATTECVYAFTEGPGEPTQTFRGACEGEMVALRGSTKFGFDPVFQPKGYDKTYAELDPAVKNTLSHRGRALEALKPFLVARQEALAKKE